MCKQFGASIGFHSGSGKSAENYQVMGRVTGSRLEIKTSGRYTYEMGGALSRSKNAADQALWRDWYNFTLELALPAPSAPTRPSRRWRASSSPTRWTNEAGTATCSRSHRCRAALEALPPSPEHMFWFEYNFLYVLAGGGRPDKPRSAIIRRRATGSARGFTPSATRGGCATPRASRAICVSRRDHRPGAPRICARALAKLEAYTRYADLLAEIAPA